MTATPGSRRPRLGEGKRNRPQPDGVGSLYVAAEDVRRSVRRRLLFANVAGGLAVITFVLLASGERLAPDLPLALTLGAPFVPAALLVLPAYPESWNPLAPDPCEPGAESVDLGSRR